MKSKILPIIAVVAISVSSTMLLAGFNAGTRKAPASAKITGDYVEARTASVLCGPCHYNGEVVTVGRDALLAWNVTGGSFEGVDLKGVRAVAAITSTDNLADEGAVRRTEVTFDNGVSEKQMAAFVKLIKTRVGEKIGEVVSTSRASVSFSKTETGYLVNAAGMGDLKVDYRPDNTCCVMPAMVWYEPISPVLDRKVGYTQSVSYTGKMADNWYRSAEDSAFYGTINF